MKEGHSRARRAVEPGGQTSPRDDSRSLLQLLAQRGHLDVVGGREGSQDGERGRRGPGPQEPSWWAPLSHSWSWQRVLFSNVSLSRKHVPKALRFPKVRKLVEK